MPQCRARIWTPRAFVQLAAEILISLYTVQGDFKLREFLKKNWHNSREDGLLC